jgi:predicted  nucleic acid-binding Zn-ribbon protein
MNLQRALSKLFADRRASQGQDPSEQQAVTADVEAKYWTQVQRTREERLDIEHQARATEKDLGHARQKHEGTIQEAEQFEHNFREFVKEKAKEAVFSRNNKGIPAKRIEEYEGHEDALHAQIHETRITYLKLRNKMKKISHALSDREKKKDGMNLIDFEQLKIENTNLNEKIEERNEDLLKLRKKATTTIHVLTHVKEKMEYVKNENAQLQKQVAQFEDQLSSLRDRLASSKRERDVFAHDNQKMKEKMPMIGSEDLLLDYEVRKKEIENCRIEVVDLTNQHHELMQWINSHQGILESMQQKTAA